MWKSVLLLIVLLFVFDLGEIACAHDEGEEWNKTRVVKGLPFCAFMLRDFLTESHSSREVYILMEPDQITESNLSLLFRTVSEKYPEPFLLEIHVSSDVEQLGWLVTGVTIASSPPQDRSERMLPNGQKPSRVVEKKKAHQWAYYKRAKDVELFRYNPDYPDSGMKTVILRGKE